jgi:hypothetical protein
VHYFDMKFMKRESQRSKLFGTRQYIISILTITSVSCCMCLLLGTAGLSATKIEHKMALREVQKYASFKKKDSCV